MTEIPPTRPILYRCTQNNGVHTVLTPAAVDATRQLNEIRNSRPDFSSLLLEQTIAVGTFTFVSAELYDTYYGAVTGTLEELDRWSRHCHVLPSSVLTYVPFSNGRLDHPYDRAFRHTPGEVIRAFGLAA